MNPSSFEKETLESKNLEVISLVDATNSEKEKPQEVVHTQQIKNVYSVARRIILVSCVLFALFLIIFLMHQNGKSIYDNGI